MEWRKDKKVNSNKKILNMDNRLKNFRWVGGTQSQGSDNNKYYPRHQSPTECGFKVLEEITDKFLQI